jgi:hypothetical protein
MVIKAAQKKKSTTIMQNFQDLEASLANNEQFTIEGIVRKCYLNPNREAYRHITGHSMYKLVPITQEQVFEKIIDKIPRVCRKFIEQNLF